MNDLLRRLATALFALALVLQPAFALRLSCAAVGKLFPERCCCADREPAQPSCCGERERAPVGASVTSTRSCACEIDLPERPALASHALERDGAASKALAANDAGTHGVAFGGVCERASAVVADSWARARLHDPGGSTTSSFDGVIGAGSSSSRAFGARASAIVLRNARC